MKRGKWSGDCFERAFWNDHEKARSTDDEHLRYVLDDRNMKLMYTQVSSGLSWNTDVYSSWEQRMFIY